MVDAERSVGEPGKFANDGADAGNCIIDGNFQSLLQSRLDRSRKMTEERTSEPAAIVTRLQIESVLRTDVGRVRTENQDFGLCTTPEEERVARPGGRLLIVADGMGGHRGGATASRLAAETIKAEYLASSQLDVPSALNESLLRANARIYSEAQANPDLRGMGTTTSALAVRGGQAWFGHVGDSRIYMVRGDEIKQLTDDHSLVASMVREGLLTAKEAETHPRRNVLQRSMGVSEDVEIDVRGPFDLREGDTFILCSDGLHGLVREPEMKEVAKLAIEQAADEFLRRALERGAPDNVTVIVARVTRNLNAEPLDETVTVAGRRDKVLFDETLRDGAAPHPPAAQVSSTARTAPVPALSSVAPTIPGATATPILPATVETDLSKIPTQPGDAPAAPVPVPFMGDATLPGPTARPIIPDPPVATPPVMPAAVPQQQSSPAQPSAANVAPPNISETAPAVVPPASPAAAVPAQPQALSPASGVNAPETTLPSAGAGTEIPNPLPAGAAPSAGDESAIPATAANAPMATQETPLGTTGKPEAPLPAASMPAVGAQADPAGAASSVPSSPSGASLPDTGAPSQAAASAPAQAPAPAGVVPVPFSGDATIPASASRSAGARIPPAQPSSPAAAASSAKAPASAVPSTASPAKADGGGSTMTWIVVAILILAAVGAWFYWLH
jgi:serine/threonine protein phosphatase PrpC